MVQEISYNSAFIVIEILKLIRIIFENVKSEQSQKYKKKIESKRFK